MKKYLALLAAAVFACANAQQALWGGSQIVSPLINPDNTVTFRLAAPKAVKVQVTGDFLPAEKAETPEGHIWKNWRIYLTEFVPLLFKQR